MGTQSSNPLSGFFRQPIIHTKLPSGGQWWADGSLNLPVTGEIPIYSMTTKDEITLRTPDALLNGAGVVDVIKSCCPNIIDPWAMPSIDVDTILIAIRIASYGASMELETKCPHCSEENTYTADLNNVIHGIKLPNYNAPVETGGLQIRLKPQTYFSVNKTNMISFEEQRVVKTITDDTLSDAEKSEQFANHMRSLVDLNMKVMVDSTVSITTPEGIVVTDQGFITEFYENTDRTNVSAIRTWLEGAAADASIKPMAIECNDCHKNFDLTITFDYANFFG
jgi:Zn finger protein HypA/HybF involved in hydrogenase expression